MTILQIAVLLFAVFSATTVIASDSSLDVNPLIGRNANGQLEVFKLGDNGTLYHRWRKPSNGAWSAWSSLGGSLSVGLAIVNNAKGQMEIFGVDCSSRNLECILQLTTNGLDWSSWTNLGGNFEPVVAAEKNMDGRIEVFAVDATTHHVRHLWQSAQGNWSHYADLGGSLQLDLNAAINRDGRLELFGIGPDNTLLHCWQNCPNTTNDWSDWTAIDGAISPGFAVGQNVLGRLEVFGVNKTNNMVIRAYQTAPNDSTNWTTWQDFGADAKPGLAVGKSGDGRLEVFSVNPGNSSLFHRWELLDDGSDKWSGWTNMHEKCASAPAVGVNEDSDLEVYVTDPDDDSHIHYRRQISGASDWLDWSSLDQPVFAYNLRSWQVEEGLPDNLVQAITQTADGFLWVGTRGGLARFDGNQFVCYDSRNTPALKNPSITALCAGRDGALWIGTDGGGLVRLSDGIFSEFCKSNGLAGDQVSVIYESGDGALWVGTTTGMSCYKNGQFRTYTERDGLLSDSVRCIYEDRSKNLWIGTGKGLNRVRSTGAMDSFAMPNGLPNNSVRVVCQDHGGRVWIGSNNGLLWYDWFWGIDFYAYNIKYGLSDPLVSAICEDGDGNLWVGTYSGLNRFHDGRFYPQLDGDGLRFDKVNTLFVDREGDLWVGSKEGLTRLTSEKFFTYTEQQGLSHNNVMSVLGDRQGDIWAGTWGGGLNKLRGEKIISYTSQATNSLSQDLILSLCEGHDGSLWIGADFDGGLTCLKDGHATHYTWRDGLINSGLRVLYEDTENNLWIGTDKGLNCFSGGMFVTNLLTEKLAGNSVRDICEDESGSLWLATQNGLARWQDGQLTMFTKADGLSSDALSALYTDGDNTLWIGTSGGGLNRYRNGRFMAYTRKQGLYSDDIFGIVEDEDWLWMTSSQGVFRVRKKDLEAFSQGKIEAITSLAYGKNDGMASPQCNSGGKPSAWKSSDGRLWFPTSKGLVTVDPKTIKINEEPPAVFIETVTADQKIVEDGRTELTGAASVLSPRRSPLRIPPGRGELEFQYTALSFSAPEKNRFRYRLESVDPGWIDAGVRQTAYYNNLAPGSYRFQVEACNEDGVWNRAGADISVVLMPHYWQNLSFRVLIAFMAAACASGAVAYMVRRRMQRRVILLEQQQAVERERGRIARDMHDQIGAGLTQIGLLGEFARRAHRNGDSMLHVEKICDTARELAQTLDEMVWMVNPRNDTLKKLGLYLAAYAEEFFQATNIRCLLEIPPGLPEYPVPAEVRHNLFLTVKEALNNVVKHSQASQVLFQLVFEHSTLEIVIEDDGMGFPMDDTNPSGNGLSNINGRIKEIGGKCDISSRPHKGTRIRMRIRIKDNIASARL